MRLTVIMPPVSACEATTCAYNVEKSCHARAITVGDEAHAMCDTFLPAREHRHDTSAQAGVGACKVTACRYNDDFECQAEAIKVGMHAGHPDCQTFALRS